MWDDYIFHYTNAAAILGMVRTRTMWATQIAYLNDGFEGKLLAKKITQLATSPQFYFQGSEYGAVHFGALREHLNWGKRYFVASFSKRPDMLTQFRMYCPPDGGYVIGFPREYLARAGELVDVEYDPEAHNSWCDAYARRFLEVAKRLYTEGDAPHQLAYKVICESDWHEQRMKQEVSSKSNEFATEMEVRLIRTGRVDLKMRPSRGGNLLVPYIEIPLPNEPVEVRIAAGPGRHRDVANAAIGDLSVVAKDLGCEWTFGTLGIGEFGYRDV